MLVWKMGTETSSDVEQREGESAARMRDVMDQPEELEESVTRGIIKQGSLHFEGVIQRRIRG